LALAPGEAFDASKLPTTRYRNIVSATRVTEPATWLSPGVAQLLLSSVSRTRARA
jgi:hypothetical protein